MTEGLTRIDTIMSTAFKRFGLKTKVKWFAIARVWKDVVGDHIDRRAQPSNLIGKTLYITVSSSTWMEELRYLKLDLIKGINARLKEELVEEVVFKLGRVDKGHSKGGYHPTHPPPSQEEKRAIERLVSPIKDEGLREVLIRVLEKARPSPPQ